MDKSILETIHESAKGLEKAGVMSKQTMREFDALCLPEVKKYTPEQIKMIRAQTKASQAVFAAFLNISTSTIRQWEQGDKAPNGASLKLLSIVEKKGLEALR